MNSNKNLSKRLLNLFPSKVVKEHFRKDDKEKDSIEEIADKNSETNINSFAFNNLQYTKQHIYIYTLGKKFSNKKFDRQEFPLEIINERLDGNDFIFTCKGTVGFNVFVFVEGGNPIKNTMQFYQPITIHISDNHLIVKFTMLEKNINSYFENKKVILDTKSNDEEEILNQILQFFTDHDIAICDINKGIKHLWDKDVIDSKFAKWKKNRSTTTEAMDEGHTLKNEYPEQYKSLMKSPLNKNIFKYLHADDEMVDHFTADPTIGQINIPLYPKNPNQINNVISKVLSNN